MVPTRWRYHAADADGASVNGEIDAGSEREAVDALRRRSLWATVLEPVSAVAQGGPMRVASVSPTAPSGASHSHESSLRASVRGAYLALTGTSSASELAIITRAMSTLLKAGVPLDRALAYAASPAAHHALQDAFARVRADVRAGESLAHAVRKHNTFPITFAPTIAAGEASGTLGAALASLADHLERSNAVRERLRAALVYPAVLGVASCIGVIVILLVVVPRFAGLIAESGGTLPFSTRALIAISDVVIQFWWLLLAAAAVAIVGAKGWLAKPSNRVRWHRARLAWPVVGSFERTRIAAAYTGVLSVALGAGVSLLAAMRLARGIVGNLAIADRLAAAEHQVQSGGRLAEALDTVLPPLAVRLLDAGEGGGNLAEMAARASEAADASVQRAASAAVSLVEPVMILGFGGVVGFVALALLQAIYGLNARGL